MENLLLWGLVPPILLLAYVWKLDRVEREPVGLVVKVFLMGAASTCAAAVLESLAGVALMYADLDESSYLYLIIDNFLAIALIEEFCKRAPVSRFIWKDPAFNYRFDAIVYCLASAVGFAAIENVLYMWQFGTGIVFLRLIPIHSICGVYMGHYLGTAKAAEKRGDIRRKKQYMKYSLIIPMLIHGYWDFSMTAEKDIFYITAFAMILVLTIAAFYNLHKYAREDGPV
ncbi:MAG TPA: hypothetical protein DCG37_05730 [Lachnospiraceae bacterium]|nr:hypothetical protein [Lachnospiraceae bacterium]